MSAFGQLINGELNNRIKSQMKATPKKKMSAEDTIAGRYAFHMSVLKSYVKYSQAVENKDRQTVTNEVARVADTLTAKYGFGAKFIQEVNKFVIDSYQKSSNQVQNEMRVLSQLPEASFEKFLDEMKDEKITDEFSPRFKAVLNF